MVRGYRTRFMRTIREVETALLNAVKAAPSIQRDLLMRGLGLGKYAAAGHKSKRLRGTVTKLVHSASGCQRTECRNISAVPELVHAASLIVDDLQDDHLQRWGFPAIWAAKGKPLAINTAFVMLSLAQELEASIRIKSSFSLTNAIKRMLEGQACDLQAEMLHREGLDGYLKIVAGKTSALLCYAIHLGGHRLHNEIQEYLCRWGHGLGVAHQIQDDIDDLTEIKSVKYLRASNLHWFLYAQGKSSSINKTIETANKLAFSYMESSLRELNSTDLPVHLIEDLMFLTRTIGNRDMISRLSA